MKKPQKKKTGLTPCLARKLSIDDIDLCEIMIRIKICKRRVVEMKAIIIMMGGNVFLPPHTKNKPYLGVHPKYHIRYGTIWWSRSHRICGIVSYCMSPIPTALTEIQVIVVYNVLLLPAANKIEIETALVYISSNETFWLICAFSKIPT